LGRYRPDNIGVALVRAYDYSFDGKTDEVGMECMASLMACMGQIVR
jgi:hypothetical protein